MDATKVHPVLHWPDVKGCRNIIVLRSLKIKETITTIIMLGQHLITFTFKFIFPLRHTIQKVPQGIQVLNIVLSIQLS